jgi:Fe(3+) dicitrate transport protein
MMSKGIRGSEDQKIRRSAARFVGQLVVYFLCCFPELNAQTVVTGRVVDTDGKPIAGATVEATCIDSGTACDSMGMFVLNLSAKGPCTLSLRAVGHAPRNLRIDRDVVSGALGDVVLRDQAIELPRFEVSARDTGFGAGRLRAVEGTAIYAAKKNEVVVLDRTDANKAVNSARQVLAKVPGLNIIESDPGGVQLGIAARGLDPNRSSNFNLRQNGYDISADALGYPEAYYVPPMEGVERIEVVRGAASLQYGPQFGGLVNFRMRPPAETPIEFRSVNTVGGYGLRDTWNRLSGTRRRWGYTASYGQRTGESWRPNSGYTLHTGFASLAYRFSERTTVSAEYTLMRYDAQQPGGLSDVQFRSDPSISLHARNWFAADWNILALALDHTFSDRARFNARAWGFLGTRDALGFIGDINRLDDLEAERDLIHDDYRNAGAELRYLRRDSIGRTAHAWLVGGRLYKGLTRKAQGRASSAADADFTFLRDTLEGSDYDFPGFNGALFVEDLIALLGGKWRLVPGFRYEHLDTRAEGYYRRTLGVNVLPGIVEEHRRTTRDFLLLGLGITRRIGRSAELYANASQNYRGITFTDMRVTRVNQVVDPELRDELGYNIDLGCKGSAFGWLAWDLSGFVLAYNDRIGLVQQVDEVFNIIRYTTNIGASRSMGAEVFVEADAWRAMAGAERKQHLVLFASLGLLDARYTRSELPAVEGNFVEFSPPITARGGITFRTDRTSITVQAAHTAEQFTEATNARFTPNAVNGAIPAYTVLDATAKWRWRWLELRAGVNNALDTIYFTRRAAGYPGPGIIPAERRVWWGGVAVVLK